MASPSEKREDRIPVLGFLMIIAVIAMVFTLALVGVAG